MTARNRSGTLNVPSLHIDTSDLSVSGGSQIPSATEPSSAQAPHPRGRARALSQAVLPSFLSPASSNREKPSSPVQQGLDKARDESRKLLAHVLRELENRPLPPSVFDDYKFVAVEKEGKGLAGVVESVRNVTMFKSTKQKESHHGRTMSSLDDSNEDEDTQDAVFSTDATFDLMSQFREVLVIMQAQGWKVFDDEEESG